MEGRPRRGNLPVELLSFVGRERELAQVRELLAQARLVTLTGPGGVGKSRLALRAAACAQRSFPGGTWLADVAGLTNSAMLASFVASAMGVSDRSAQPMPAVLAAYLEDKRLLLVLDNCEHLTPACASLVGELLAHAPGLRVLATSRRPLGCDGEHVLAVPPLPVPDPDRLPAPPEAGEYPSLRLFAERASVAAPGFVLADENRVDVARVCRRLDGIPLAIELAAARAPVLVPEQLLARLDDRLRLLTAGHRAAPARQQTLRATLDWSHALCSRGEQQLWARAAVFARGFDLDAAEEVCSGQGIAREDVFELVAGLVDKSILLRGHRGRSARYSLLETVGEYGRERLAASGYEPALRLRHRDYYLRLLTRADADIFGPRQVRWLDRLQLDTPNLRLALDERGLSEPGPARTVLETSRVLEMLWISTGRLREGHRWLTRALELCPEPSVARARALAACGLHLAFLGRPEVGLARSDEGRALGERLHDPLAVAAVAQLRCQLLLVGPDLSRALPAVLALAEEGVAAARAARSPWELCNNLVTLSLAASLAGDPRAAGFGEEGLALCEAHGAEWSQAWALNALAFHDARRGEHDHAAARLRRALTLRPCTSDAWGAGLSLEILAWTAAATGQFARAARLLGACHSIWRSTGAFLPGYGPYRSPHDTCERSTRAALGEHRYAEAFDWGAALVLDEAIAYALGTDAPARRSPPSEPTDPLTRREREVAWLVAEGLTHRQIAARLVISARTASSHIEHILGKLNFTSRAQLAAWITRHGDAI